MSIRKADKMHFLWLTLLFSVALCDGQADFRVNVFQAADKSCPQFNDFPEASLSVLQAKPNVGIAVSGGGARAFAASLGYLSALNQLGLLKNVKYLSGISGGGWATLSFLYRQNKVDDASFLGPILYPENLTPDNAKDMADECGRQFTAGDLTSIAIEGILAGTVTSYAEAWSYAVSKVYLEPTDIVPDKYFSWNNASVQDIITRNPQLSTNDFVTMGEVNRPFPIVGISLVGPSVGAPYLPEAQNYSMIDITPLYIGQMRTQTVDYKFSKGGVHSRTIGGAIESFAFPTKNVTAPTHALSGDTTTQLLSVPQPAKRMDLRTAAGATSYALGTFFESLRPYNLSRTLGMHFDYWSPSDPYPKAEDTLFADGGSYQNIPLIGLLQRRVKKIILFSISSVVLFPTSKYNPAVDDYNNTQVTDDIACMFGVFTKTESNVENRSYEYEMDQVFSRDDYVQVITTLQAAQAKGNGIFATFNLTTVANTWWGIPAGLEVEVTFSLLGRLAQWEEKLTPAMKELLVSSDTDDLSENIGTGPYRSFPNYATTAGDLNYERANVLADMVGWSVLENADLFRHMLS